MSDISAREQSDQRSPRTSFGGAQLVQIGRRRIVETYTVLTDFIAAFCVLILSRSVFDTFWPENSSVLAAVEPGNAVGIWAVMLVCLLAYGGLYARRVSEAEEVQRTLGAAILLGVFSLVAQGAHLNFHNVQVDWVSSIPWVLGTWLAVGFLAVGLRLVIRSLLFAQSSLTEDFVLVGSGDASEALEKELLSFSRRSVRILKTMPFAAFSDADAGKLRSLISGIALANGLNGHDVKVVLAPNASERDAALELKEMLVSIGQPFAVDLSNSPLTHSGTTLRQGLGSDLLLAEVDPAGPSVAARAAKQLFDFFVALVLVVILAPLMLLISALLLLEPGGVFFSQLRVGKNGERFQCLKFRTMLPDAQERLARVLETDPGAAAEWAKHQKLENDPRVTSIGKFLRATSLDELPQIFNVLRGEMSLVGPRPIIAPEVDGYPGDRAYFNSPDFQHYAQMTPGITGLWQVSGRTKTLHSERIRLDRWYACNWSFWLDIVILLRTVRAVLVRTGC
ncbi:MAG: exopolysaccharide biosynthesis polyprenyl glycosylphosphotransferase [Pseudomonadota bacterium]